MIYSLLKVPKNKLEEKIKNISEKKTEHQKKLEQLHGEIDSCSSQIEESKKNLATLQNDYDGLMVQYDTKMSDSAIEEYAREKLGMQKRENFQLEWISVGEQEEFKTQDDTKKGGLIDLIASYFD